jgi:hypothetical protein
LGFGFLGLEDGRGGLSGALGVPARCGAIGRAISQRNFCIHIEVDRASTLSSALSLYLSRLLLASSCPGEGILGLLTSVTQLLPYTI